MRLSWNEIRARAARFADDWRAARYEHGETQTFYNEFFAIFGVTRRRVAAFEAPVRKLGDRRGVIDLFWKGVLLVEQKSAGRDLGRARQQALDYFPGLRESDLPRYLLVSDFQTFELHDLDEGDETRFALADLPAHVEAFGFILGVQKRTFRDQDPVNIAASELMGRLHDALKASGYGGHDLERFLVRLLFCLFADDTGIFEPRGILFDLIEQRTSADGGDLGMWLSALFEALNTPEDRRQISLDEDLARFPYINGDLFEARLPIPACDAAMRALLLEACAFNWDAISPAIFGALFQSVMHQADRRAHGAHYTTERNILKVIQPLFLDDLRADFARLKQSRHTGRRRDLLAFQERLGRLRFLDPACGCGNFLIVAYRELRQLEIEVLRERRPKGQYDVLADLLSVVDVDQFHGIEIDAFPARIAETALWMMDHIMNSRLGLEFGQVYARIPLATAPRIRHADALEIDWASFIDPAGCDYILGNPPFAGAKYQTPAQRAQVRRVAGLGGAGGTLDYVAAWFVRAGEFIGRGRAEISFVATNSIAQGEQVAQLWPILFDRLGLEISFAHRTFAWASEARGKAHVHVVIIGLTRRDAERATRRLFSYDAPDADPTESHHPTRLTPYLVAAADDATAHVTVREAARPLSDAPKLVIGSKPIDGGNYIFDAAGRAAFLAAEPKAECWLRPYVGAEEYINDRRRWILALDDCPPGELRRMPEVRARVAAVRALRAASKSAPTQKLADTPTRFHVTVIPDRPFLVIPKVNSERRAYVPIGWLEPPTIPSDLVFVLCDAELWRFGVLTSAMHMAWLRHIGGRLGISYRYSIGLVYNTFPWPPMPGEAKARVAMRARAVLAARAAWPDATLADLYDPVLMKPDLRRAHRALDAAVDKLYRPEPFDGDGARAEHLLALYEKRAAPLAAQPKPKRRRRTRKPN